MSHPRFHSYPYFTGALMTRLVRDVLMLSDGLSAFCFMGVSAFGFGGLAVSLVLWHFNLRWYTFFSSFRNSFRSEWSGGVNGNWLDVDSVSGILRSSCVVLHSIWSLTVHCDDCPACPSGLLFFMNMTVRRCSSLGDSPALFSLCWFFICFTHGYPVW